MKKRMNRFLALTLAGVLLCSLFLPGISPVQAAAAGPGVSVVQEADGAGRQVLNFNTDWLYKKGNVSGASGEKFADNSWGYVNLPHSTTFYTAENKDAYLGVSWYRKHFRIDQAMEGKKLSLTFEAAMQKADVYINGELAMTHEGGYIPFVLDITDLVRYGEENVIAVKIDSRADSSFAPGKEQPDFQYFGGIYGNARLTVQDTVYITDPVEAEETAGGGVFITAPQVSEEEALLKIKTQVKNGTEETSSVTLLTEILDENEAVVESEETALDLDAGKAESFEQSITVENPRLWSVDTPELYTVRTTVTSDGEVKDATETVYGIRKVEWKRDGLYINDKKTDVEGANLHEETYMFGNAMPDNAIYEEIKRFKENGFDIMRMSHYPHRQAYYDACDKYGVMVVECPSGWQYFNNTDAFKESTYRELRTDIRHKRNHPCIVAWESSLNETHYTQEWAQEMNRIVKEEYPAEGQSYPYTAGCYYWNVWDIGLSTPQAGIFTSGSEGAENPAYAEKPMIIAEYGDWTYGGSGSTTRVTREAENSSGKKGGDEGMLIQADNVQESVQTNRSRGANWLGASMYWDYADYAGFDRGIMTYCGVVDLYRIPKYAAYFYQSQRSADTDLSKYGLKSGPMVYIANAWDEKADTEVRIFSNCDTVELFLNGESLGEKGHDTKIWGPHGDGNPMYYPSGSGKEISADYLKNAPITFQLDAYEAGELKAVGKIDGKEEAVYVRKTPGRANAVALRPESEEKLPLDGSSAKLVWIHITDEDGTVVTSAYTDVNLEVEGPGLIVGPKTITTKGGQLAVWVKSKRGSGDIVLRAEADGLYGAAVTIPTESVAGLPEVPEGGDADEYERQAEEEDGTDNIFLGKSVRASSENPNGSTGAELKEKANDGDESTKWCASSGSYPQWWEADLGAEYTLENMFLSFETAGKAYHYAVAVSDEPMTDENYEDHIVVDHRAGSTETELKFEEAIKGRYVRVTLTQAPEGGEWAVLREVSGTGETDNIAFNKPVSASSVNNSWTGLEKAEYAVDGNQDTYWCAVGGAGTKGHWIQVDLRKTYRVSQVCVSFEKEDAAYRFVLQGSVDGKHYKDLKDFREGAGCGQSVEVDADTVVQYIRVYDISTKDMASQWPAVREIEVYGEKTVYQLENVGREKEAFASSNKEGVKPGDGNNGVPNWFWYPEGSDEAWWCVDTGGIYELDNVQMTWNALENHKYRIDISTDGENWVTAVDRSVEGSSDIQPYEAVSGTARYIRVVLPAGREKEQGFGLFSAYAPAPKERRAVSVDRLERITVSGGTGFSELPLPKEVDVVLDDGICTSLPVNWQEKGYDGNTPGRKSLTGTLAGIPGAAADETLTASIEVEVLPKKDEDRTELKGALETARKKDLSYYTKESADAYRRALAYAEQVFANEKATQEEVNQALQGLKAAEAGLHAVYAPPVDGVKMGEIYKNGKYNYRVTSLKDATVEVTSLASKSLKKVKIGNTVTLLGKKFRVTSIAPAAFKNNKKIKSVVLGANVETVGAKAFYGCASLTKVTLPGKVKKIGKQAFCGSRKLGNVTIKTKKLTKKTVGSKAFREISQKAVIRVPASKKAAYRKLLRAKGVGGSAKIK